MHNKPGGQSHRSYTIDVIEKPAANQITLNEPTNQSQKSFNPRSLTG
jgi:hypothetical protein